MGSRREPDGVELLWRWFKDFDAYPADERLMKETAEFLRDYSLDPERRAIVARYLSEGIVRDADCEHRTKDES